MTCRRSVAFQALAGFGPVDLGDDQLQHAIEQVVLVAHVPVEGHRLDAQLLAELAHAQALEALAIGQLDGGREHALPRQGDALLRPRACLGCHLTSLRCSGYVYGVVYGVYTRSRAMTDMTATTKPSPAGAPLARPDDLDRPSRRLPADGRPVRAPDGDAHAVGDAPAAYGRTEVGQERVAILGFIEDGPNLVTPAMNGWADPEPAWWLNLQAQPEATVESPTGPRKVVARAAVGEERERLWRALVDLGSSAYTRRERRDLRSRETAIVVLEPRRLAAR